MKKLLILIACLVGAGAMFFTSNTPAHADYFQYPCPYPFVGSGADVQVLAHGGGQYCDGPQEINGTHYHCMAGGGGLGGGAIGLAPIGGLSAGGFGGSGFGINLEDCHYVCPDLWRPQTEVFPNPPAAWVKHLVVADKDNICFPDHMAAAGPDSAAPPGPPTPAGPPPPPGPGDGGGSVLTPGNPLPGP